MILRTCDRCGAEMEPIYLPPYVPYAIGCTTSSDFKPVLSMSIMEESGRARPVDLCEKCSDDIYNDIFNYHDGVKVMKNG